MKLLGIGIALALAVGCGDNSDECGPGTMAVGGVCTPGNGSGLTCGVGTMLDPATQTCVPATDICGDGTVLIGGSCQDPNAGITVDLEEGPEPNGFEAGASSAGMITLAPVGDPRGFVIHGCIAPVNDTADFDRYYVSVAAPTLLDITAAGVDGLQAGFSALDSTFTLQRYGLSAVSATSEREVYLPAAGTYSIVLADTRTWLGVIQADELTPAGNPDGTSCYYVTIQQETPVTVPLSIADGATGTMSGKLTFFAVPEGALPNGFTDLSETIASAQAAPALEVVQNGAEIAQSNGASAEVVFGGVLPADDVVVVADEVYDYAVSPPTFALVTNALVTAEPLPLDGSTVNATTAGQSGETPGTVSLYYVDLTADELAGLRIDLSQPMGGGIVDATFAHEVVSLGGGAPGSYEVFTSYHGLIRNRAAGRYYLALYAPSLPIGTSYTLTSRLEAFATPSPDISAAATSTAVNPYDAAPFTLTPASVPWSVVTALGTSTGDLTVALYDPATAYGRLQPLAVSDGATAFAVPGASTILAPMVLTPDQLTSAEYIFATLAQQSALAVVTAAAPSAGATFAIDVAPQAYTALGALPPGDTARVGDTIAAGEPTRYLFAAPKSSALAITASGTALTLATLNPDATVRASDVADHPSLDVVQDVVGITAFELTSTAQSVDVDVDVTTPFYVASTGSAPFADACSGGVDVSPADTDDGITAPISTPVGFAFYGTAAPQVVASTNGFLSFNTALANAYSTPSAFPAAGDVAIAPFWEDLDDVQICAWSVGTALIVQWTGRAFADGTAVQFQAILDASTNRIVLAFGPGQADNGTADGAIQGVQSGDALQSTLTGDGTVQAFGFSSTSTQLVP